ncbi:MAG: UvrD-helicase domain-containing protein, partial [Verrucomicrobiaceae bacterium]|nr:UvrD-helicase domain-containing protein [Verrucomicrobiaceae bacterium]
MSIEENILEPYLMIKASAGSGKTYQLSNRIIGKIGVRGEDPQRMIALTFTRKAAGEFADDLMEKLQKAAMSKEESENLQGQVNGSFEAEAVLEQVVKALPRMQLGTMDSFFAQIVRSFQYELGLSGGDFDLIEGPQLELAMKELIREVISEIMEEGKEDEFVYAFRRATKGKEDIRVAFNLEDFVKDWHSLWKSGGDEVNRLARFGGRDFFSELNLPEVGLWEKDKHRLVDAMLEEIEVMDGQWTDARQRKALIEMGGKMRAHTIGSGVLEDKGIFHQVLEWVNGDGPPIFQHYKEFELSSALAALLKEIMHLIAGCETSAAIERTEGIGHLIRRVNAEYDRRLKSRALLSFDDVKILMGSWQKDEGSRLQREMVDFRLDGSYDHWFLDEFQDTSQGQWDGLKPLLDEVASDPEGSRSLFIIGDKKQSIYGWRGGKVALFDQVQKSYRMESLPMDKSYRSCRPVLDIVNAVCCNSALIGQLFGENVRSRWDCNEHTPADANKKGEARVEVVENKDEMYVALTQRLQDLEIGKKQLSCGILLRTRNEVRAVADHLRLHKFDVIEDGRRKPMEDNPIGVVLFGLISWLADPADLYSRNLVEISPLEGVLTEHFKDGDKDGKWLGRWESLLDEAHSGGFSSMTRNLLASLWRQLPQFGKRRAEDILAALENYDLSGMGTSRGARDWLAALEIVQPPTDASVQVMTIHGSKGLGFDVVMLPMMSDKQIPSSNDYNIAHGQEGWILQPPASWVRSMMCGLGDLEEEWKEEQRYEALCLLYVAMTRAKLALNIFLLEEPKSRTRNPEIAGDWASSSNLLRRSVLDGRFAGDDSSWQESIKPRRLKTGHNVGLGEAEPLRERFSPSGTKAGGSAM